MSKKTTTKAQKDHSSDQQNPNKGTAGTNTTYDKVQGHRGTQKNPNNKK